MSSISQTVKVESFLNSDIYGNAVLTNRQALYNLNQCLASAGIATATTTSKLKIVTATVSFMVDGAFQSIAATDNFWTLTGSVVPIGSYTKYLLLVNSAGAASVLQSSVSQVSLAACIYPSYPDGFSIFGVFSVTCTTAAFTPGTTTTASGGGITTAITNGFDKYLLPLLADANNSAQMLQLSGVANSGSLLL